MGTGAPGVATSVDVSSQEASSTVPFPPFESDIEADEKEVFSLIKRPRVRYDVEVVTKLVVYSGGCIPMRRIGELWMLTVLIRNCLDCDGGSAFVLRSDRAGAIVA